MPRYNHALDIAFEVISEDEDGEDITPKDVVIGLLRRIADCLENDEVMDAVDVYDTYEMEEE